MNRLLCVAAMVAAAVTAASPSTRASAATSRPPGLQVSAVPSIADVGDDVILTLKARSWPAAASASVSFVSAHHGFRGAMQWEGSCSCFQIAVSLARRVHPLEPARATATVNYGGRSYSTVSWFQIRGLAANGRDFSPGGTPYLSGWVSDPQPFQNQFQHYCAWVRTADGLGIAGLPVTFAAHFQHSTQSWHAGKTHSNGLLCSNKSVGSATPGVPVPVDIYAGSMHVRTTFTPHD